MALTTQHDEFGGREVLVLRPEGDLTGRPLLFCHDAQNLLDPPLSMSGLSWRLDVALECLESEGVTIPVVVGIPSRDGSGRLLDYAPEAVLRGDTALFEGFASWFDTAIDPADLTGDAYADLVVSVVDWAHERFGTDRSHTALMGSSMGGLASWYALSRHPHVYEAALCLSTHWTPGGHALARALVDLLPEPSRHRVWTDHGDLDIDVAYGPFHETARAALAARGWREGHDVEARSYPGTGHHEGWWAQRVDQPLRFWLTGSASPSRP